MLTMKCRRCTENIVIWREGFNQRVKLKKLNVKTFAVKSYTEIHQQTMSFIKIAVGMIRNLMQRNFT